jgi:IMP cyclohydrolase
MLPEDILRTLKADVPGATQAVYQILSTFLVTRRTPENVDQVVIVQIFDAGVDADPKYRYHCVGVAEDGRTATGNTDSSIEKVLLHMHWEYLDQPVSG